MDHNILYKEYLQKGTAGYAVIRNFYSRYNDILVKTDKCSFDDVLHEVFISLSKTNYSEVENIKHYTLRAIKLRCWSILDKAIKTKEVQIEPIYSIENPGDDKTFHNNHFPHPEVEIQEIHGRELFAYINLFKSNLEKRDRELLNQLIDGMERKDIAKRLDTNINTLDTHIRRLRIRLAEFLGDLGYSYQAIKKFGS